MVGWGGIQGGRFTSIVQTHKLHNETMVSARGKRPALNKNFSMPDEQERKLFSVLKKKFYEIIYFRFVWV